ncbi:MAG: 2-hydroxyacyl-CoA dehydratase family protein, partial [Dehalococcoidia bacterium]|nr:2-hydroxyacyl-CoA dehydratase family protein [Dehalococcoidia bacterium]
MWIGRLLRSALQHDIVCSAPEYALPISVEPRFKQEDFAAKGVLMQALERLASHMKERPSQVSRLRQAGAKVVGFFPGDYVPEELIYAAGAVPLCLIHGGDTRPVDAALTATIRFLCPFSKAQYGEKVLGEQPYYGMVDLLVAAITCQHLRKSADLWNFYTETPVFRLGIPHEYDSDFGLNYYADMLRMLRKRLKDLTGNEVKDARVREGIALYNRMRSLLKDISVARMSPGSPLSTLDFIKLNHASCYADPAFMVEVLASVKEELGKSGASRADESEPR